VEAGQPGKEEAAKDTPTAAPAAAPAEEKPVEEKK
jgi:hypothetical protein